MTERWVKMVGKAIRTSSLPDRLWLNDKEVVTLLARQHRAFVRMVKKYQESAQRLQAKASWAKYEKMAELQKHRVEFCNDILAALAKQGGGT